MEDHFYIVTVTCKTKEQATKVMTERIGPDEDYGFEYSIDWQFSHRDTPIMYAMEDCSTCDEPMLWDPLEQMYYCPNTWEHG